MADLTVSDEKVLERDSTASFGRDKRDAMPGLSRAIALAVGLGCVAILFAYVALGSVRIEVGPRKDVRYRVGAIWSDFTAYLAREGASSEIVLAVAGLAALSLLGSCLIVALAFAIRDDGSNSR